MARRSAPGICSSPVGEEQIFFVGAGGDYSRHEAVISALLCGLLASSGQEPAFKLFLHSSQPPESSCYLHTNSPPAQTIIAYADSLLGLPINETNGYFELPCSPIINLRSGWPVEKLLRDRVLFHQIGNAVMKWAIEVQKTSLEPRNLADLLKGLGFDLIQGNEYSALSSPSIDACATAADAFEIAKSVRAAFKGPAKIDPEFVLGSVIDYATMPLRRHAFVEAAPCVIKITAGTATITVSPPKGLSHDELAKWREEHNECHYQAALERQRALLEPAFLNPKAAKAIELLCIENPSGETLYKIYELAEGQSSDRLAFHAAFEIDKEQFNRFKDAVHNPAVTGDWARHANHQKLNSTDPMTRAEAEQFVRRIADRWLQSIRRSK